MELAQAVEAEFDKENVAPPAPKSGIKPNSNHHSGAKQKHSDDDSTDCFVVESSTSEQSARASPIPGILSSATFAHVEGQEKVEEASAEVETVTKKKRKKKKKKKKKVKPNDADVDAAVSNACADVDMRVKAAAVPEAKVKESSAAGREVEILATSPEAQTKQDSNVSEAEEIKNASPEAQTKQDSYVAEAEEMREVSPEAQTKQDSYVAEAEEIKNASPEAQTKQDSYVAEAEEIKNASPEAEEGEIVESSDNEEGRNFDVLDDAAVLAVGRRPLIELGTSSESEPDHRPIYDEEYVTVDEEAPTLLLNVAQDHEGDAEEDASPEPACVHAEPFVEPDEEMVARIVRQMEFYFSDANILKDYFLLRRVRKSKGGWVRISLLAGFKLVQSITKDIRQVVFALKQKSRLLETDELGVRVRRRGGLPCWDHHVYKRSCLVYGFDRHPPRRGRPNARPQPDNVSVQFVREKLFPKFDPRILLVRILKAGKEVPLDLKTCVRNHPQLGQELCVVVEFDTVPTAETARSSVDGRRWSQSHRLWAKILGKRPRLPEEWAARFGAQRAELLHQQQQQQRDRRDPNYFYYAQQQQQAYQRQQQLLEQLYYQHQQQKFLEELQRRRWGEKKVSYAESVRGKKRPAPESYADKVRGIDAAKSDAEPAPEAEAPKVAPRVRARAKKSSGEAGPPRKSAEKALKPKAGSYAAAARTSSEAVKTKDVRRDGATQTSVPQQSSERKDRTGFQLLREPRGPGEAGSGPAWVRQPAGAVKNTKMEVLETAPVKNADVLETAVVNVDKEADVLETAVVNVDKEAVKSVEVDVDNETAVKSEEADDSGVSSPDPSSKSSGLARRRSVRELVRQFEALKTAPDEECVSPQRRSMTPRPAGDREVALDDVEEV